MSILSMLGVSSLQTFKRSTRSISTQTIETAKKIFNSNTITSNDKREQGKYVLSSIRSFPSLEPHSVIPVHSQFLNSPLRRDLLWFSVIMELDNRRVGASNPPGRSQHKFSRRKLFQQKGTGRARVGDANSPIRYRGSYALAKNAPNDLSSKLNSKVYQTGYRIALSQLYREGRLFIIGSNGTISGNASDALKLKQGDEFKLDFKKDDLNELIKFIDFHKFNNLNLLFISDEFKTLHENSLIDNSLKGKEHRQLHKRVSIIPKEEIEVRDLLKANRVFIDEKTLEYFANKFGKYLQV